MAIISVRTASHAAASWPSLAHDRSLAGALSLEGLRNLADAVWQNEKCGLFASTPSTAGLAFQRCPKRIPEIWHMGIEP
jgi:hypothetical protein